MQLDSGVRRLSNGTALLGGSPFRLIRLTPAGAALLDDWLSEGKPTEDDQAAPEPVAAAELRDRLLGAGMLHPLVDPDRDTVPTAAVVVPVLDDAPGLERLVQALQRDGAAARIVVVDDGSAAGPAAAITDIARRHGCELERHETNRGPAAARNTGRRRIATPSGGETPSSDVIVFLDADVVPGPGAVRTMLAHFADERLVAVAPRVRAAPDTSTIARYEAADSPLDMGPEPAVVFPGTRLSYVPSAALAVRLDAIEAAGGFDEALRYGEDVDLVWRLVDAGGLVRYDPVAVVEHRCRGSLRAFARQRFSYGSSAAELAERHRDDVAPLQLPAPIVASTVGLLLGGTRLRALGLLGAAGSTLRLRRTFGSRVEAPEREAVRLTVLMHGYALRGLVSATTRTWAPMFMLAKRSRRLLFAALVVPALLDWLRRRPAIDPLTHVGMRAIDHGSYCVGVWSGVLHRRSIAALLPSMRVTGRLDDDS